MVKVGDRVLVEASYNVNMPFKWNASRIQVLPHQCPGNNQTNVSGFKSNQSTSTGAMSQNSQQPGLCLIFLCIYSTHVFELLQM